MFASRLNDMSNSQAIISLMSSCIFVVLRDISLVPLCNRMRLTCPSRHIDKVGGLDNYILTVPKRKQQSDIAEQLRQRIEGALQKPLQDALQANTEAGFSAFAGH